MSKETIIRDLAEVINLTSVLLTAVLDDSQPIREKRMQISRIREKLADAQAALNTMEVEA